MESKVDCYIAESIIKKLLEIATIRTRPPNAERDKYPSLPLKIRLAKVCTVVTNLSCIDFFGHNVTGITDTVLAGIKSLAVSKLRVLFKDLAEGYGHPLHSVESQVRMSICVLSRQEIIAFVRQALKMSCASQAKLSSACPRID